MESSQRYRDYCCRSSGRGVVFPKVQNETELVAISDVHLVNLDSSRGKVLLELFDWVEKEVKPQYFILMGDIFEFYLGSSRYFEDKFAPFWAALHQISKVGTKVIFIEGNHEFELKDARCAGVQFMTSSAETLLLKSGARIAVGHGDLIYSNFNYRLFRSLVKSRWVQFMVKSVPGRLIDGYALRHAKVSRAADRYRSLEHSKVLNAMKGWALKDDVESVLFGHFHVPYSSFFECEQKMRRRIVSFESWEQPNLLIRARGEYQRLSYQSDESKWIQSEISWNRLA
jgi:UDP-2,3-diacylglucosamine hydrolase